MTAINGQPIPSRSDFHLSFSERSFSTFLGCNRAGGDYRIAGDQIIPGSVRTTLMACAPATEEPAVSPMTFEEWGFAILSGPMRMTWLSDERLTLDNAAGSIDLLRVS